MDAGLGRGGIPGWFGRGPPPGPRPRSPLKPNGLFPAGLGPGRDPGRASPPRVPPGRGVVPGAGRGPVAAPASGLRLTVSRWRAACTAASCSAFNANARASAAATSISWALAGFATGTAGTARAAVVAAGLRAGILVGFGWLVAGRVDSPLTAGTAAGMAGAAGAMGAPVEATKTSRNRRATGASMVLDADLTYSPIS